MLARKNRFSFKNRLPGKVLNSPSFSVRYEKGGEGLKVAVVVSKRVDRRATARNKIRRQVISAVSRIVEITTPLSAVFYIKKGALEMPGIEKEITQFLEKIK